MMANKFLFIAILLSSSITSSCSHIPKPPERDEEIASQCADWNYRQSVRINDALLDKKSYQEISDLALPLTWGTQALCLWLGRPENIFNGDIKKLAHDMDQENAKFRKEMIEWKDNVAFHSSSGFSFSTILIFCLLGSLFGITTILILFKKLFM